MLPFCASIKFLPQKGSKRLAVAQKLASIYTENGARIHTFLSVKIEPRISCVPSWNLSLIDQQTAEIANAGELDLIFYAFLDWKTSFCKIEAKIVTLLIRINNIVSECLSKTKERQMKLEHCLALLRDENIGIAKIFTRDIFFN